MPHVSCLLVADEDGPFAYRALRALETAMRVAAGQKIFGQIVVFARADTESHSIVKRYPPGPVPVRVRSVVGDWSAAVNIEVGATQDTSVLLVRANTLISSNFVTFAYRIVRKQFRSIVHPEILIVQDGGFQMRSAPDQISEHFSFQPVICRNIWGDVLFMRREHLLTIPLRESARCLAAEFWRWNGEALADWLVHRVAARTLAVRNISNSKSLGGESDIVHSHSRAFGIKGIW